MHLITLIDDRKRPGADFHPGDGFHGDMKKPRTEKPPATLRILVRNRDAGGIIGKVCVDVGQARLGECQRRSDNRDVSIDHDDHVANYCTSACAEVHGCRTSSGCYCRHGFGTLGSG